MVEKVFKQTTDTPWDLCSNHDQRELELNLSAVRAILEAYQGRRRCDEAYAFFLRYASEWKPDHLNGDNGNRLMGALQHIGGAVAAERNLQPAIDALRKKRG